MLSQSNRLVKDFVDIVNKLCGMPCVEAFDFCVFKKGLDN